jgi:D-alanyl-lipoteichoic acid acyltransferase DltB (MBOAT superfamily)
VFAVLFFAAYFALRGRPQLGLLLFASYIFYGWWDWRFLILLGFSTLTDYSIGRWLGFEIDSTRRRRILTISVVVNLGILGFFKYFNFFADNFVHMVHWFGFEPSWTTVNILLPVGVSFYTFQSLSYTIDVYRGRCPVEHSLLRFASFVALFPQLVAGPIARAANLLPQFDAERSFDWQRTLSGLELIAWGYFLKLVLADTIGQQLAVDRSFEMPERYGASGHVIGAVLFAFQIYGDFAGYSAIAIGLARIMGFDLGINFRRPYFSATFSEFWQRWHISLSSWLRDYLYIPLGGSRRGALVTARNLFITMFLGGLWHGAAWTFIVWGLLHGLYLTLWHFGERVTKRVRWLSSPRAYRFAHIPLSLAVFALTTLAWIFFRSPSLANATEILGRVATWHQSTTVLTTDPVGLARCGVVIFIVLLVDLGAEYEPLCSAYTSRASLRAAGAVAALWSISLLGTFSGSEFIYFQF